MEVILLKQSLKEKHCFNDQEFKNSHHCKSSVLKVKFLIIVFTVMFSCPCNLFFSDLVMDSKALD